MSSPAVSIIVPVYNAEPYMHRCIDSLLNQTLTDVEILLINDGSTDTSAALCDEWAAKDPRVKVFHRTNHGVAATRQFGLEHVTGKYVIHADPDDWLDLNMLEKMYTTAEEDLADMVICDYIHEYGDHTERVKQQPTANSSEQIINDFYDHISGSLCNKLIRLETIRQYNLGFIDKVDIGEDMLFTLRLLQQPIRVSYCSDVLYHYDRISTANSYSRTVSPEKIHKRVLFFKKWREIAHTETMANKITNNEIQYAYLSLKTQAYTKEEFFEAFQQLREKPLLKHSSYPFAIRFIVWFALHIHFRTAELLIALQQRGKKRTQTSF